MGCLPSGIGDKAMKTGLVSVTFRKLTIKEIIELAKENSLKSIEWGSTPHIDAGEVKLARKVRSLMHGAGLTCESYGSYYGILYRKGVHKPYPFKKLCKTAVALGAKTIRIWPGFPGMHPYSEEDIRKAVAHTREICNIAKKYGLTLSMECHFWTLTENYKNSLDFIKRVGCDNLKIYWQPNPYESKEYNLEAAKALLPYVTNVHVCHWIEQNKKPLREGLEDWKEYFEVLKTDDDRVFMLEFMHDGNPESLPETAKTLHEIMGTEK